MWPKSAVGRDTGVIEWFNESKCRMYNAGKHHEKHSLVQLIWGQLVQISARGSTGMPSTHSNQVWKQLVQISVRGSTGMTSTHNNQVWKQLVQISAQGFARKISAYNYSSAQRTDP